MEEIEIGDIFHDINHEWTDGSNDLDMIHIILSKDKMVPESEPCWKTANYMWSVSGYCGARTRYFSDKDVLLMKKVGNISEIIKFNPSKDN